MIDTSEIEKLYIDAADDFRTLCGGGICELAPGYFLEIGFVGWWVTKSSLQLPDFIAVPAMTETWRERLEREHGIVLTCVRRPAPWSWYGHAGTYPTLPEAIVAAVKALAAEKRAEAGMEKMGVERVNPNGAEHLPAPVKALAAEKRKSDRLAAVKKAIEAGDLRFPSAAEHLPAPDDLKARLDMLEGRVRRIDNQLHQHLNRNLPEGISIADPVPGEEGYAPPAEPPTRKDSQ